MTASGPPLAVAERADALRQPAFVGLLATAFIVAIGFGLIVPVLPLLASELGATYGTASFIVSTFAAVRLISSAPAGAAVDRFGARAIVATGLLVVAVSTAALTLAGGYTEVVLLRAAGGVGSAMFITGIGQHLIITVPARQRGRANGLLNGAFLLGGASGPAVGGIMVDAWGLSAPFLVYAGLLTVAAVVAVRFLRAPRSSAVVAGDPSAGNLLDAAAAATGPPPRVGALLRDRTFLAVLLMSAALNWTAQGTSFIAVPLLGRDELHASPGQIGLALAAASVAHGAMLWPVSRWVDTRGRRGPARLGIALYVVATIGLATVGSVPALVGWLLVSGAAGGMVSAIPSAVVGDLAAAEVSGRAVGILGISRDLGAVFGPLATGVIAESYGFDVAFLVAAGLLTIALVGAMYMRETLAA